MLAEKGEKHAHTATISVELNAGEYTIEASTWQSERVGEFELDFDVGR